MKILVVVKDNLRLTSFGMNETKVRSAHAQQCEKMHTPGVGLKDSSCRIGSKNQKCPYSNSKQKSETGYQVP